MLMNFHLWPIPEIDIKPPLPPVVKFAEFAPYGFSESGHAEVFFISNQKRLNLRFVIGRARHAEMN